MVTKEKSILDQFKESNIKEGDILEVIIFKGADYCDGQPGPTSEIDYDPPKGYSFSGKISKNKNKPGDKILGYLEKISEFLGRYTIILKDSERTIDIEEDSIHSYKKLVYAQEQDSKQYNLKLTSSSK